MGALRERERGFPAAAWPHGVVTAEPPGAGRQEGSQPVRRPPVEPGALRLTRRGRRISRALLALAAALAVLSVAVDSRADAGPDGPAPTVVVESGDTLWNIATSHAPRRDPYPVMAEIQRLNRMPDSTVRVGERLVLPRR